MSGICTEDSNDINLKQKDMIIRIDKINLCLNIVHEGIFVNELYYLLHICILEKKCDCINSLEIYFFFFLPK